MAVTQVAKTMWTPEGEIPLREKDVIPIDRSTLIHLAWLHEFAHKYGITMTCQRCDKAITGANSGHEAVPSVACQCREWRHYI